MKKLFNTFKAKSILLWVASQDREHQSLKVWNLDEDLPLSCLSRHVSNWSDSVWAFSTSVFMENPLTPHNFKRLNISIVLPYELLIYSGCSVKKI